MCSIGRVCQLVAGGLDINGYDSPLSRNTALHWAASFADVDTINCLIGNLFFIFLRLGGSHQGLSMAHI